MVGIVTADDDGEGAMRREKQPQDAPKMIQEYTREQPFWLEVKGYENCHGQPWTELPDSLLQLMIDAKITAKTPEPYAKAAEIAGDEIARRIEEAEAARSLDD